MDERLNAVILLPWLRVENANCISGPLTWGFPPPQAFAGFAHALHRQLGSSRLPTGDLDCETPLALEGVGIVCHRFEPQVNHAGFRYRFNLSKNPVDTSKKIQLDGSLKGASLVEEGRAHLEVSLLIGVRGELDREDGAKLTERVSSAAQCMRLAGGSILPQGLGHKHEPAFIELSGYADADRQTFRQLRRRLLPGFALLDRSDLLQAHHAELRENRPEINLLDTLLDLCALHHEPVASDDEGANESVWRLFRRKPGWLVPLPIGYGAVSPLYEPGEVKNARDPDCPFRFVESLYSLGEWRSPHRIERAQDFLWFYEERSDQNLYLVQQTARAQPSAH